MKIQYVMCQRDLDEPRVMVNEIPMPGGQNGWLEKIVKMAGAKKQAQQVRLKLTNDVDAAGGCCGCSMPTGCRRSINPQTSELRSPFERRL